MDAPHNFVRCSMISSKGRFKISSENIHTCTHAPPLCSLSLSLPVFFSCASYTVCFTTFGFSLLFNPLDASPSLAAHPPWPFSAYQAIKSSLQTTPSPPGSSSAIAFLSFLLLNPRPSSSISSSAFFFTFCSVLSYYDLYKYLSKTSEQTIPLPKLSDNDCVTAHARVYGVHSTQRYEPANTFKSICTNCSSSCLTVIIL